MVHGKNVIDQSFQQTSQVVMKGKDLPDLAPSTAVAKPEPKENRGRLIPSIIDNKTEVFGSIHFSDF